jgi:hypothetical protein
LTSENEKKENINQSKSLLDFLRKDRDHTIQEEDKAIAERKREVAKLELSLAHAKGDKRFILTLAKRFVATQVWLSYEATLARQRDYLIALRLAQLEDAIHGRVADTTLTDEIENAKKNFDEHIAKRVGQLFGDKDDLGYVV